MVLLCRSWSSPSGFIGRGGPGAVKSRWMFCAPCREELDRDSGGFGGGGGGACWPRCPAGTDGGGLIGKLDEVGTGLVTLEDVCATVASAGCRCLLAATIGGSFAKTSCKIAKRSYREDTWSVDLISTDGTEMMDIEQDHHTYSPMIDPVGQIWMIHPSVYTNMLTRANCESLTRADVWYRRSSRVVVWNPNCYWKAVGCAFEYHR